MQKLQAIHYGEVKLILGIKCDGYVLSDGTAVMSLRGITKLLDMDHAALVCMVTNSVKVTAKNSPYQVRNIVTYA